LPQGRQLPLKKNKPAKISTPFVVNILTGYYFSFDGK
jgi:hypothetical protein